MMLLNTRNDLILNIEVTQLLPCLSSQSYMLYPEQLLLYHLGILLANNYLCKLLIIIDSAFSQNNQNSLYILKCEFRSHPFILIIASLICSVVFYGYILYVLESAVPDSNMQWNIYNGMWFTFITMATVGYGDFFPVTIPGRIVTAMTIFTGAFLMSLLTVILSMNVALTHKENKVYRLSQLHDRKRIDSIIAGKLVSETIACGTNVKTKDEKNKRWTKLANLLRGLRIMKRTKVINYEYNEEALMEIGRAHV